MSGLPVTGVSVGVIAAAGLALAIIGGVMRFAARRGARRRQIA